MATVRAHQNETVDALCWRVLGRTEGVTEQTLRLNRGLSALGPQLPQGTPVTLPEPPSEEPVRALVQLWD
jgi:phage tail protein X